MRNVIINEEILTKTLKDVFNTINVRNYKEAIKRYTEDLAFKYGCDILSNLTHNNCVLNITIIKNEDEIQEVYYSLNLKDDCNIINNILDLNNLDYFVKISEIDKEIVMLNEKKKLKKSEAFYLNYLNLTKNLVNKNIDIISTNSGNYICNEHNVYNFLETKELEQIIVQNLDKNDSTLEELRECKSKLLLNNYKKVNKYDNVNKNEEIIFNNCVYNFKTNEIRKIEKEDFVITYVNSPFTLTKKEPTKLLKFLNEALKEEEINVLQEFLGYSLKLKNDYKNFLMLKGVKNSGKSTIANLLMSIIGQNNICSVRPSDLDSAEKSYRLKGSLVNIVPELSENEIITDSIKKVTSGGQDAITIRKRFFQEETLVPCAKTILTSNYNIKFKDDNSFAIESRMLLINFKKSVAENKINKNLVEDLINEELTEILNWMIIGLKRLEKRGHFIKTLDNKCSIFNKMKNDNLTFKFIAENIETFKDKEFFKYSDFKSKFENWLKNEGYEFNITNKHLTNNLNLINIKTKDFRLNSERANFLIFGEEIKKIEKMINENNLNNTDEDAENLELIKKIEEAEKIENNNKNEESVY